MNAPEPGSARVSSTTLQIIASTASVVLLLVLLVHSLLSWGDIAVVSASVGTASKEHLQFGQAVATLATALDEQSYILDQLLPEGRRLGLGMPPTLRRKIELGREYPGDPWQRRRPATPHEPRWSIPDKG